MKAIAPVPGINDVQVPTTHPPGARRRGARPVQCPRTHTLTHPLDNTHTPPTKKIGARRRGAHSEQGPPAGVRQCRNGRGAVQARAGKSAGASDGPHHQAPAERWVTILLCGRGWVVETWSWRRVRGRVDGTCVHGTVAALLCASLPLVGWRGPGAVQRIHRNGGRVALHMCGWHTAWDSVKA